MMTDNNSEFLIKAEKSPSSGSVIMQHQTEQHHLYTTTVYTEEVGSYTNGSMTQNSPSEDKDSHNRNSNNQEVQLKHLTNVNAMNSPPNDYKEYNNSTNKHSNSQYQISGGSVGLDLTAISTSSYGSSTFSSGNAFGHENNVSSDVDKSTNGTNNMIPPQSNSRLSPKSSPSSPEMPPGCAEFHNPSSLSPISNEEVIAQRNNSPTNWHMPKNQHVYIQDLQQQQHEEEESDENQHQQQPHPHQHHQQQPGYHHQNPQNPPPNAYGMLRNENEILYITESRIEIGRNSSTSMVHFHVAKNSFVSRKHFQVILDQNTIKFYLICLSKNGVFVDNVFQRRYADPFPLPKRCTFRFPSTEIRIIFESYLNPSMKSFNSDHIGNGTNSLKSSMDGSKMMFSPLKISIPKNEHKSPYPSPTGTMSAANSCPTSPRQGFQDYHSYNNYNNNNNNSQDQELFHPPSTSNYNDLEKPPYSYAQLIVQAISSAADRQLTLSGIYSFISQHYPYYRKEVNKGWQNSIRHNLSLNRYFIKVARSQDEPGKGSFWRIEPTSEAKLIDQSYKKRRQRSSQCFRPPFGMPRSAPVSPNHLDNSHSPENEIELQSAPVSPGGTYHIHTDNNHSSEEISDAVRHSQNMDQSPYNYNQYNIYQHHSNNNRTGHIVAGNGSVVSHKRHYHHQSSATATSAGGPGVSSSHIDIYDEMQESNNGIDSDDESDNITNKRQKCNSSDAER